GDHSRLPGAVMRPSRSTSWLLACALGAVAAAATGCNTLPDVDQSGGNAPLIVDLDGTSPLMVTTTSTEVSAKVRQAIKGSGETGGITGTFVGNGGPVCVVLDPENRWEDGNSDNDDGDSDLFVGRASDYTGTPGVSIGGFTTDWVDPLGQHH